LGGHIAIDNPRTGKRRAQAPITPVRGFSVVKKGVQDGIAEKTNRGEEEENRALGAGFSNGNTGIHVAQKETGCIGWPDPPGG